MDQSPLKTLLSRAALAIFVLCAFNYARAQDERFFRKIFTDELRPDKKIERYKIEVSTPNYEIDLNRDGRPEVLKVEKRDGQDFFLILGASGEKLAELKLDAKGLDSVLYKVQLKTLSSGTDALILYFDEGKSGTVVFQSTARIYMASIDQGDLEKISFIKGPAFYYEKERPVDQYSRRYYNVSVFDFNKDGTKEVAVSYNDIQRIYFYLGKGRWQAL